MISFQTRAQRADAARAARPLHARLPRQHRLYLPVVVDECDILRVRRAVIQNAGGTIEIVRCVPLRNSTKARLIIEFQAGTLGDVVQRIMQSIKTGALGRIGLAL